MDYTEDIIRSNIMKIITPKELQKLFKYKEGFILTDKIYTNIPVLSSASLADLVYGYLPKMYGITRSLFRNRGTIGTTFKRLLTI